MRRKKPTYLDLEISRNRRLWCQKVIVPMTLAAAMVLKDKRNREDFKNFVDDKKKKLIQILSK